MRTRADEEPRGAMRSPTPPTTLAHTPNMSQTCFVRMNDRWCSVVLAWCEPPSWRLDRLGRYATCRTPDTDCTRFFKQGDAVH